MSEFNDVFSPNDESCGFKNAPILLKGQTLQQWENWIKEELTPPVIASDEVKYTLEAFLELIEKFNNLVE